MSSENKYKNIHYIQGKIPNKKCHKKQLFLHIMKKEEK